MTLNDIGQHLDLSAPAVLEFCKRESIDRDQISLDEIRIRYIRRLREVAAGRSANGDSALAAERALLAREQRERVAMINARMRRELAPVTLLESALADVSRQCVARLEAIPVQLKREHPGLDDGALSCIEKSIDQARHAMAQVQLALDTQGTDPDDDDDPEGDPPRLGAV